MTAPICERHEEFMAVNQEGYICLSCLGEELARQEAEEPEEIEEAGWREEEADTNDYKMSQD